MDTNPRLDIACSVRAVLSLPPSLPRSLPPCPLLSDKLISSCCSKGVKFSRIQSPKGARLFYLQTPPVTPLQRPGVEGDGRVGGGGLKPPNSAHDDLHFYTTESA